MKKKVIYKVTTKYSIEIETENIARDYFFNAEKLKDGIVNKDMTNALVLYSVLQQINPDKIELDSNEYKEYEKYKNDYLLTLYQKDVPYIYSPDI